MRFTHLHQGRIDLVAIAVLLGALRSLESDAAGLTSTVGLAAALTVGVLLFFPIRHGARWLTDRFLYRDVPSYEAAVRAVRGSREVSTGERSLAASMAQKLGDLMGLESVVSDCMSL